MHCTCPEFYQNFFGLVGLVLCKMIAIGHLLVGHCLVCR